MRPFVRSAEIRVVPGKGRAMFATEAIAKGEIVETCPAVVMDESQRDALADTAIGDYLLEWDDGRIAVPFGSFQMCNHSPTPNLWYEKHLDTNSVSLVALRDIAPGEELTYSYGRGTLWFEPV